jgi:hypothetical protein
MVDVSRMPENAFGYVPTPALVAPIEFTLKLDDYSALGGYMDRVRPLSSLTNKNDESRRHLSARPENPWPFETGKVDAGKGKSTRS